MDTQTQIPQNPLLINQPTINPLQPVPNILNNNFIHEIPQNQFQNILQNNIPTLPTNNIQNFIEPINIQDQQTLLNSNIPENQNNEKTTENDEKKVSKVFKRRSKSEIEGRTFECKLCNKSYLSYPALYTHYKQKHNTNNSSGRGRGRPKKEQGDLEAEKSKFNPINSSFFQKEDRTGTTDPTKINECILKAFDFLYEDKEEKKKRNEIRGMKNFNSINDNKFFNKFLKDPHNINKNIISEDEVTDNVFIDYLNKMSKFCKPEYYIKLIVFVTLFREHVNKYNIDKVKIEGKEFTEINNAEDVPDSSNEFITDFLDPDTKGADFGFSKEEAIDLTQNLCYWMYENNFTCSKLSLIHAEKQ